jgi:hypothetical protein
VDNNLIVSFPSHIVRISATTMTTLDPSHNPFRTSSGRHAQAIHRQDSNLSEKRPGENDDIDYPELDDLHPSSVDAGIQAERKGRREGRRRVRAAAPPMPDLRFEQVSVISLSAWLGIGLMGCV